MQNRLDLVVIGIYFVVLILVGVVFGRLVKTGKDYFRAGRSGSWWMVGTSMFMSGISAYTFVGIAAAIYTAGWSMLIIYIANATGYILGVLFFAAWYRQLRVITFAEIIRQRFGKATEQFVAYLIVINGYLWSGVVLYTLAVFAQILMPDAPVQGVILAVGAVVLLYCTVGGNWAVMANDFVQGLVLIAVTVTVTLLCLHQAGGISGFFAAIAESDVAEDFQFLSPGVSSIFDWTSKYGLTWMILCLVMQTTSQISVIGGVRYFSAKDGREASRGAMLAGTLMVLGLATFFIPPMYAHLFLADQVMAMHEVPAKAAQYSYAVASYNLLPKGTFAIMIIAIFAAAISTMDTGLNANAGLIVRDLLPPLRRWLRLPPLEEHREVWTGKLVTLFSGALVMAIALMYSVLPNMSIFDLMMQVASRLTLPLTIPLTLIILVRRVPRWCIWSSLAGGFLPSAFELFSGNVLSYQISSLLVIIGGGTGFFIAKAFWPRVTETEKRDVADFYKRMTTKVDFAKEVGVGTDAFQLIQIGRLAMLVGLLLLGLLFNTESSEGVRVILSISGFIGGIGFVMHWRGKHLKAQLDRAK